MISGVALQPGNVSPFGSPFSGGETHHFTNEATDAVTPAASQAQPLSSKEPSSVTTVAQTHRIEPSVRQLVDAVNADFDARTAERLRKRTLRDRHDIENPYVLEYRGVCDGRRS